MTTNIKETHGATTLNRGNKTPVHHRKPQFSLQSFFERRTTLVVGDTLVITLALVIALVIWQTTTTFAAFDVMPNIGSDWYWMPLLLAAWGGVAWLNDMYDLSFTRDKLASMVRIVMVALMGTAVFWGFYYLIPHQFNYLFGIYFLVTVWLALICWRMVYASLPQQAHIERNIIIVGTGETATALSKAISEHHSPINIVGYIAENRDDVEHTLNGITLVDDSERLSTFVRKRGVTDIVIARRRRLPVGRLDTILECFDHGVRIITMPELFEKITGRIPVEHIDDRWLIYLPVNWNGKKLFLIVKRAMDIVMAGLGLAVLSPLMPLISIAIKLDSRGPVFYRPERLGRQGRPFRLWKFRTMVSDADKIGDPTFTARDDARVTRVGRILRATHVDELPQFINILLGEMSVVGPRPERYVAEMQEKIPYYRTRLAVKPGATGWGLVKQGYAEGFQDTLLKLQYDLYYIKHQSLVLDLVIICKTVIHMFTMRGR